jgi:hypothetical protein
LDGGAAAPTTIPSGRICNAMAFVPVANVAHITLEGVVDRQQTINDLYFEVSGGGITPTNLLNITSAAAIWFQIQLSPFLSDNWAALRARGRDLTSAGSFIAEANASAPGGVANEAAPNNVAACIKLASAVAGRSFRGRNYVPAVPNSEITLNTMSPSFISNVENAYNQLVGPGVFLAGWQLVVVSRFTGGSPGVPSVPRVSGVVTPVTLAVFVNPFVKSMRSREVGHGK